MTIRPRHAGIATLATLAFLGWWLSVSSHVGARPLPAKLSDQEYWGMVVSFSEPGGTFRSNGAVRTDNLVSNETSFQHVIPALQRDTRPGAYLGVGPEQNFTYITALKPTIAFIIDIRRENMLLHLMYKALVEMSADRVDFLSHLFSRPPPDGAGPESTAVELFDAFRRVPASEPLFQGNLRAVLNRLERTHGFRLRDEDEGSIESAYRSFYLGGPDIRWDSSGASWIPSYADLMTQTDRRGHQHSFLSTEEQYGVLRQYETDNRIVPLVGDFGGTRTLRAVGRYLSGHNAAVAAFYTSNVESYLFRGDAWRKFFVNVSKLPIDEHSTFVRTHFTARFSGSQPDYETSTALDPIQGLVNAFTGGTIRSYGDLLWRSKPPAP
jgi:hypothetical protein